MPRQALALLILLLTLSVVIGEPQRVPRKFIYCCLRTCHPQCVLNARLTATARMGGDRCLYCQRLVFPGEVVFCQNYCPGQLSTPTPIPIFSPGTLQTPPRWCSRDPRLRPALVPPSINPVKFVMCQVGQCSHHAAPPLVDTLDTYKCPVNYLSRVG